MPSSDNFSYMMLNLVGEVGEFASKVAKAIRKEKASIEDCKLVGVLSEEESRDLQKEAGDCMWQIAGLCKVMGWNLEDVCQDNLDKLASRKKRDVIDGSGDNR
jgi:NTP pyrophosphatase (non-canonical NTP hydrolase)